MEPIMKKVEIKVPITMSKQAEKTELIMCKIKEEKRQITIHDLNYDCLEHIFHMLKIEDRFNLAQVCKRWKECSTLIWRDFPHLILACSYKSSSDLEILPFKFTEVKNSKRLLKQCGGTLKDLTVGYPFDYKILYTVVKKCPNLERLVVIFETYCRKFKNYLMKFPHLKSFKIKKLKCIPKDFWENVPDTVTELYVGFNGSPRNTYGFNNLLPFKNVTSLTLRDCDCKQETLKLPTILPQLTSITFKKCALHFKSLSFLFRFLNLKTVSFHRTSGLTKRRLHKLVSEHVSLRCLNIINCSRVYANMVLPLSKYKVKIVFEPERLGILVKSTMKVCQGMEKNEQV